MWQGPFEQLERRNAVYNRVMTRLAFTAALLLSAFLGAGCSGGGGAGDDDETPTPTPSPSPTPAGDVHLVVGAAGSAVSPFLFGANTHWMELGDDIVLGGELLADRSFRAGSWGFVPGTGTITVLTSAGAPAPGSAPAYDGYVLLDGASPFVLQALGGPVFLGSAYTIAFSSFSETSAVPPVFAGLATGTAFTAIATTQFDTTIDSAWKRHTLTLTPTSSADEAVVTVGIAGSGTVRLDEVRLMPSSASGTIDPVVRDRIASLGIRSLRYPGGILVDTFEWPLAIGPLVSRGEALGDFGKRQTPSFGLDEFLALCESEGLEPLLQVNVLDTPQHAAELVEYVNGPATSTFGAMRAANGHPAPWGVTYWELGNEPSFAYVGGGADGDGGASYAALSAAVADAMLAEDPSLVLSGALEASFQLASYLPAVPILANWNDQVLANTGLLADLGLVHGHFYAPFLDDADTAALFRVLMASGTVLRETRAGLAGDISPLPLWITEYGIAVQSTSGALQPDNLIDYQAGLVIADVLLTLAEDDIEASHVFDLSQAVGYGLLVHPRDWDYRPSGLAFQLIAPIAGEPRHAVTVSGAQSVTIDGPIGNLPQTTTYPDVIAVVTSQPNGAPRVVLLNRSFDTAHDVSMAFGGGDFVTGSVTMLSAADVEATNEVDGATIALATSSIDLGASPLTLPPHSLVRIDFDLAD